MRLDHRPLLDTRGDVALYVESGDDARVLRSLSMGLNVLVHGERAMGRTSLVRHAQWRLRQRGGDVPTVPAHYVSAASTTTTDDVLVRLLALVEDRDGAGERTVLRHETTLDLVETLRRVVARQDHRPVFILDDVTVSLGRSLFGSLRDELWTVGATWLVTCLTSETDALVLPPVDAFFEAVVRMAGMDDATFARMLRLRTGADEGAEHLLADLDEGGNLEGGISSLASLARGRPRHFLDLARRVVVDGEDLDDLLDSTLGDSLWRLSHGALALFREVELAGALGPSDPRVQARAGLSRPRLVQLFHELRDAGLVREVTAPPDGPGRPKVLYRLCSTSPDHVHGGRTS